MPLALCLNARYPMEPEHPDMDGQNISGEFQTVHPRFATERKRWEQERAELLARIAQLEQSEARFRRMIEAAPYVVVLFDQDFRYRYANPSAAAIRGLPQEAFVGKHVGDIWPEPVAQQMTSTLRRVIESDKPETIAVTFFAPGKPPMIRLGTIVRIPTECGHEILAASHDITASKQMLDELREADHHKSEFIAILSHELRNPLGVMRNNLSILERSEPKSAEANEAHAALRRQTSQLGRLVDDLLDLSRIEQNKVQLKRERLDIAALLHSMLQDFHTLFEQRGISLEGKLGDRVVPISGDRARVVQMIGNLLLNASKFTPPGGHVTVTLEEVEGQEAHVRVQDDGAGIEPTMLDSLFRPFVQADRTLDRSQGGLGLGLSLVSGLAALHGASVSAHSEGPGKGSLFILTFPCDEGELSGASLRPAAGEMKGGLKVLIIEDNIDAAKAMRMLLKMDGYQVEVAHDGPFGLEQARKFRPDIVFCDIGLPGMSGYEVAKAFQSDPALKHIYLVALTGYTQPEDLKRAAEAGFAKHIRKPAEFEQIEAILAERVIASGVEQ